MHPIHPSNIEALAQHIARDFARHLRPQARQMPMFIEDDFVNVTPDIAWNSDVYIDDDYIFGAHVVVVHRKTPDQAINSYGESLFIHRYPPTIRWSGEHDPEYITHWFDNEHEYGYGGGGPKSIARLTFVRWYEHVCEHHTEICERLRKGDPNPYGVWSPSSLSWSSSTSTAPLVLPLTFKYSDVLRQPNFP